jgi:hypothetical protein
MAVRTKGRRKIMVNQRQFVWYIADDYDSNDNVLHVVSEDKKFIVNYHLGQPEQKRFIATFGSEFPGLPDAGGCWIRVLCPEWEQNSVITPGSIHRLVDWCLNQERELIRVDDGGKAIIN